MGKLKESKEARVVDYQHLTLVFAWLKIIQSGGNLMLPWLGIYLQRKAPQILEEIGNFGNCGGTPNVPLVTKALKVSVPTSTLVSIGQILWINWAVELIFACVLIQAARKNHAILMKLWTIVMALSTIVELTIVLAIPGICLLLLFVVGTPLLNGFGIWIVQNRIKSIWESGKGSSKVIAGDIEAPNVDVGIVVVLSNEQEEKGN